MNGETNQQKPDRMKEALKEIEELNRGVSTETATAGTSEEKADLKRRVVAIEKTITLIASNFERLSKRINDAENMMKGKTDEDTGKKMENLSKRIDGFESRINNLSGNIESVKSITEGYENLNRRISDIESKINSFSKNIENAKTVAESYMKSMPSIESKIKEHVFSEQSEFLENIQKNFDSLKRWIDDAEEKISALSKDLGGIKQEMEFWRNENDILKTTLEKNNLLIKKIFETFEEEAEK